MKATDLDKAWHALHFLLTGTAWGGDAPLNFLLLGGREVGTIDVGYGPARAIDSRDVARIAAVLAALEETELRNRYRPREMMRLEIYPEIWDREPADLDAFAYVMEHVGVLRCALREAVEAGLGLVVFMS